MPRSLKLLCASFQLVHLVLAERVHGNTLELAVAAPGAIPWRYLVADGIEGAEKQVLEEAVRTPLGSLWKVFVYFYLAETDLNPAPYLCKGSGKEELFCCKPRGAIGLDDALAKSCGLFFSPTRLSIKTDDWRTFWKKRLSSDQRWLTELSNLKPSTELSVSELLAALNAMQSSPSTFARLSTALSRVTIDGTARGAVSALGAQLRVKTYTWDAPSRNPGFVGGFAGWLSDGRAVWARGRGTSSQVLKKWAFRIDSLLDVKPMTQSDECVIVEYFDRYPLREVRELPLETAAHDGPLVGKFRVDFANGNSIEIISGGELRLIRVAPEPLRIVGKLPAAEYVARVIDREVKTLPVEAARALSVVIRTYLFQNAARRNGCLAIADSTSNQRVSANPASDAAREIANWSHPLILHGVPFVRYHASRNGDRVLSWARAVEMANARSSFLEILRTAYPGMSLGFSSERGKTSCQRISFAEAWLQRQSKKWARTLAGVEGFQPPVRLTVCRTNSAQAYSDTDRDTIYLNYSGELEDQLAATHEYLHLAFKYHPLGANESFIETRARELNSEIDLGGDS